MYHHIPSRHLPALFRPDIWARLCGYHRLGHAPHSPAKREAARIAYLAATGRLR